MANSNLSSWFNGFIDWIWPRLTDKPEPPPDERLLLNIKDESLLDAIENTVEKRTGQIDERLRGVETKLVALLTLTFVLSAAVTASFAILSTTQMQNDFPVNPIWLIVFFVFYIVINLLRSLWCTVSGLTRRGYKQLKCEEILPKTDEDVINYKTRVINERLNFIKWNDWALDQKVSDMAVAHVALRNALVGTGGVILMIVVIAVTRLLLE